jgi:hypothetical protein
VPAFATRLGYHGHQDARTGRHRCCCGNLCGSSATHPVGVCLSRRRSDRTCGGEPGNGLSGKPIRQVELEPAIAIAIRRFAQLRELQEAQARVNRLHGLLPICSYCKKVRDDHNYWQQVEAYISAHSDVHFSHGICPDCYEQVVKPALVENT